MRSRSDITFSCLQLSNAATNVLCASSGCGSKDSLQLKMINQTGSPKNLTFVKKSVEILKVCFKLQDCYKQHMALLGHGVTTHHFVRI